jgi:Tol biopolymer transport system component
LERNERYRGKEMRFMRRIIVKVMLASLVAVAVAVAAWVTVTPQPAEAEFPGKNGRIAFQKKDSDGWQIWVANKYLSNQVKLTSESANSGWAVWNPRGTKLAFDSDRADLDTDDPNLINDVFTMNPDGTGLVRLTHSGFNSDPGWAPDGKKIAFGSDRRNGAGTGREEIYIMRSNGSHARRVSTLPAKAGYDTAPRFSPNGNRLVFTRYINEELGRSALFTVNVDGSGLKQITPWGISTGDADWAPDGKKLVVEVDNRCRGEIYTVDPDGKHLKNITHNTCQGGIADPVWSPNGKKILFGQARDFNGAFAFGLATMKPDGTDRHFILPSTNEEEDMHQPDWESVP